MFHEGKVRVCFVHCCNPSTRHCICQRNCLINIWTNWLTSWRQGLNFIQLTPVQIAPRVGISKFLNWISAPYPSIIENKHMECFLIVRKSHFLRIISHFCLLIILGISSNQEDQWWVRAGVVGRLLLSCHLEYIVMGRIDAMFDLSVRCKMVN